LALGIADGLLLGFAEGLALGIADGLLLGFADGKTNRINSRIMTVFAFRLCLHIAFSCGW
jgi:hypothetical protein